MSLADLRADLATALTDAGIAATLDPAESFTAPGAVILSGDPYLQAGGTFGLYIARFQVFLFVDPSPMFADEADELISTAVAALADYDIESISGVDVWDVPPTNVFLGAQLILTTEVAKEEI